MMSRVAREKKEAREAKKAAKRAWVMSQPKEERRRITDFAVKLFTIADKCRYKVTSEGIGRFMRAYIDKTDQENWRADYEQ